MRDDSCIDLQRESQGRRMNGVHSLVLAAKWDAVGRAVDSWGTSFWHDYRDYLFGFYNGDKSMYIVRAATAYHQFKDKQPPSSDVERCE